MIFFAHAQTNCLQVVIYKLPKLARFIIVYIYVYNFNKVSIIIISVVIYKLPKLARFIIIYIYVYNFNKVSIIIISLDINHEFIPIERTFIEGKRFKCVDEVASSEVKNVCDLNTHVLMSSYEQGACIFGLILNLR